MSEFLENTRLNRCVELILEDIPGGCVVEKDDFKIDSTEMKEGALLGTDANGIYHLTKTAEVWTNAASGDTSVKIYKEHEFKTGEILINTARTGTSRAISAIDSTSSISYDDLELGSALGVAVAVGDILVQVSTAGVPGAVAILSYSPVAIATNPVDLLKDNTGCGLLVRGRVKESLMPYPIDASIKAMLPLIRFV